VVTGEKKHVISSGKKLESRVAKQGFYNMTQLKTGVCLERDCNR